ncbi:MAG: DUF3859 domain-containing protein [Microcoleus sp. PH2017_10_PVI_O_A]|uniref:DUF3859 domain-containing protein n=1 Tax=unclassified Microcoleus TaxID=2642155 RepID=UPI001D9D70AF|nr:MULTISPECIES: DUF3859 domain-containing protein [unclassified Microcoleus]TAE83127.1 MAG: DUF3859 domain-containing protein [Oscillatoriales cyanobacterium]MCC3406354.1 DUF3859 domain-containing protein [Microcoleus sp. PH2017_10_PVI_O_A]MCC3460338.1 DUF3859 domain-containing protein [Microcoleus sp. PH2017_11_PCY_U_A]MCC3478871.1 DUF3859 domain-containing protein [Microcoleus sp. PH2017_12_PCY_D_A]MCC3559806.1 DUF3859 domain-containing protein [Microcoleus sp. PH2017_27_LUM_O_A]
MENRLTQTQLTQIVAEVQRLSNLREAELSSAEVTQILQELGLPTELLDEALIQLQRREALAQQERRNRWIAGGVAAAAVGAIALTGFFIQQSRQALDRISVQQNRITSVQDDGGNLTVISRQNNPEIFYRTTLKDAPLGKKLSVTCDWIDPSGQVVKQNRYQTREIDKPVWNTQCRHQIGTAAASGNWQVKMFLESRAIGSTSFQVK